MAKPIITIIGLGLTGASIGLGLQRTPGNFEIVGHDKNPEAAQQARRQGAVQRVEWNLYNAYAGAELIVLAVPVSELQALFTHISQELKPNTLVFALVDVMQPAIDLAEQYLPEHRHFVVGHPILSGVGGTLTIRADLMDEATFCIAPGVNSESSAVQMASDFVERLGAKPLFVDVQEHDGMIAGVEQLPQLLAGAMMHLNSTAVSWRDVKRLAGRSFAQATVLDHSAEHLFGALQANRQHLLLRIDQLQQELADWRELLVAEVQPDQSHPLLAILERTVQARLEWEAQSILKNWDVASEPLSTEAKGSLRQMFFGNLLGKSKKS